MGSSDARGKCAGKCAGSNLRAANSTTRRSGFGGGVTTPHKKGLNPCMNRRPTARAGVARIIIVKCCKCDSCALACLSLTRAASRFARSSVRSTHSTGRLACSTLRLNRSTGRLARSARWLTRSTAPLGLASRRSADCTREVTPGCGRLEGAGLSSARVIGSHAAYGCQIMSATVLPAGMNGSTCSAYGVTTSRT